MLLTIAIRGRTPFDCENGTVANKLNNDLIIGWGIVRLIAELYHSERFMKICILLLAIALLAGCENVQPPTNEQVKKVADLCEKKGLTVELFYNGTATRVSCNQP